HPSALYLERLVEVAADLVDLSSRRIHATRLATGAAPRAGSGGNQDSRHVRLLAGQAGVLHRIPARPAISMAIVTSLWLKEREPQIVAEHEHPDDLCAGQHRASQICSNCYGDPRRGARRSDYDREMDVA